MKEIDYLNLTFEEFADYIVDSIKNHTYDEDGLWNLCTSYYNNFEANNTKGQVDAYYVREVFIPAVQEMKQCFVAKQKSVSRYKQTKIVLKVYDNMIDSIMSYVVTNIYHTELNPEEFVKYLDIKIKEGIDDYKLQDIIVDYINNSDDVLETLSVLSEFANPFKQFESNEAVNMEQMEMINNIVLQVYSMLQDMK